MKRVLGRISMLKNKRLGIQLKRVFFRPVLLMMVVSMSLKSRFGDRLMPLRNLREHYRLRAYFPGPLVYPFTPMLGRIPVCVLDRLAFRAYESQFSGELLDTFMIRAWEQFRYPHLSMLHALLDMGLVRRISLARGNESWEWVSCGPLSSARSASEDATEAATNYGFSDVSKTPEFSSSVVVAPRISPTYSTPL